MRVKELVKILKKLPQNAPVCFQHSDGEDSPFYVGEVGMATFGGHERLDDAKDGGFVSIAKIKKHRAVVLRNVFWGELAEPSIVRWMPVKDSDLHDPDFYKSVRGKCALP